MYNYVCKIETPNVRYGYLLKVVLLLRKIRNRAKKKISKTQTGPTFIYIEILDSPLAVLADHVLGCLAQPRPCGPLALR